MGILSDLKNAILCSPDSELDWWGSGKDLKSTQDRNTLVQEQWDWLSECQCQKSSSKIMSLSLSLGTKLTPSGFIG